MSDVDQKPSNDEKEFDQFEESYESLLDESVQFAGADGAFFTQVKADELVDIAERKFDTQLTDLAVLDVGSGPGAIHRHLAGRFGYLTGVDIAPGMISAAQKNNPDNNYVLYDGYKLPFADNSFDMAYTICVMHHVPSGQWGDYLAEMKRVVRTGGVVVVIEHNPLNPLTRHVVNNCEFDENAVLLYCGQLRKLFAKTGFRTSTRRYILFTPFAARIFRWFDRVLYWLPLGAQYCVIAKKE